LLHLLKTINHVEPPPQRGAKFCTSEWVKKGRNNTLRREPLKQSRNGLVKNHVRFYSLAIQEGCHPSARSKSRSCKSLVILQIYRTFRAGMIMPGAPGPGSPQTGLRLWGGGPGSPRTGLRSWGGDLDSETWESNEPNWQASIEPCHRTPS